MNAGKEKKKAKRFSFKVIKKSTNGMVYLHPVKFSIMQVKGTNRIASRGQDHLGIVESTGFSC